jgi:threonine dehydrogenase-like Zn-dependent dehydrogenase
MTEQEQRDLAWRVAESSNVFDFEKALELVRYRRADAEKILRMREETAKDQEELARAYERLHRAALEFR